MALPTFPRVKLWRDKSAIIDRDSQDAILSRLGRDPFFYDFSRIENFHPTPAPVHALYQVTPGDKGHVPSISALIGNDRLGVLDRNIYGKRVADACGATPQLFEAARLIANATRVCRFAHGGMPGALDDMAAVIEADAAL